MKVLPTTCLDSWKRYWRKKRRNCQRLNASNKSRKKMETARLGNKIHRGLKIRLSPKLIISPVKHYLTKFYYDYINSTIVDLVKRKQIGSSSGSGVRKDKPFRMISSSSDEVVDGRLILEIYNRMIASRELAAALV